MVAEYLKGNRVLETVLLFLLSRWVTLLKKELGHSCVVMEGIWLEKGDRWTLLEFGVLEFPSWLSG